MKRRDFLKTTATAMGAAGLSGSAFAEAAPAASPERPNVLWISVEDISPDLGCYGDEYAVTPNLDAFAKQGTRFDNAFAHMGVCAPARSGIITGCYPTWLGTNHMRCKGVPPPEVKCFPEYLRAAGYYCTNRSKTDYQFNSPATAWDTGAKGRDWRGRAEGQPFFSVINLGTTHESRIRSAASRRAAEQKLSAAERHDPAKAPVPPYHPDTPIVRRDWAQYADNLTMMDKEVARILNQLKDEGLADNTIVWFWGDHGRGLPRGKRWIYDSGLRIPLMVRVPEQWRRHVSPGNPAAFAPGTATDELVSFVDFAPTMLSLCGVPIPKHVQGQAFLGPQKAEPRRYVYAARDRVDEAYDMIRAVGDGRYKYLRNFMAHLPRSLDIDYMNQMPTMKEMRRLNAEGKLKGAERQYFECPKPVEELYDTQADPHEVNNLADDPKHAATLARMRAELFAWMKQTGDFGLLPEGEFDALKRPNDQWEVTAAPGLSAKQRGEAVEVALTCATAGASIAYRLAGKPTTKGWSLYTKPLALQPGQRLTAKACRLGFNDSPTIRWSPGEDPIAPEEANARPHWRQVVDQSGLVERALALKALDGQPEKAIDAYVKALTGPTRDQSGSVRYWAVLGLHTKAHTLPFGNNSKTQIDLVRTCLTDPSPAVRIAAAHALADWGKTDTALPVLIEVLKDPHESTRLLAATALNHLGEKARPLLTQIRALAKGGYPRRMVKHIERGLGG